MATFPRVAMFTPLPPARTGTAEYAEDLIAELEKLVQLEVFERPSRRIDWTGFDAVIYQIANNPYHAAFYPLAQEHPGIAVLHEVNLHDITRSLALRRGGDKEYLKEIIYEIFGHESPSANTAATLEAPQ